MASINWLKCTTQKIGSLKVHLDDHERTTHDHSNKHIDKTLTHTNEWVGCDSFDDMKTSWMSDIQQADREHPPLRVRSDRVTAVMLECPFPRELGEENEKDFFDNFYKLAQDFFGPEHVHGMAIHREEVHDYNDHGVQKTSLVHGHMLVSPYCTWSDKTGDREGINGKYFKTKARMTAFNKQVNTMCVERYGKEYNTHGVQKHKTVEELKRETETRAIEKYLNEVKEVAERERASYQESAREKAEIEKQLEAKRTQLCALDKMLNDKNLSYEQICTIEEMHTIQMLEKEEAKKRLEKELDAINQDLADKKETLTHLKAEVATAKEVTRIDMNAQKTLSGQYVKIPVQDYKTLLKTAKRVDIVEQKVNQANKIIHDRDKILDKAKKELERPMDDIIQSQKLQSKLDLVEEHFPGIIKKAEQMAKSKIQEQAHDHDQRGRD